MLALRPGPLRRIALLGAHCDDLAIGAGGTLLAVCAANPGLRVDALVLSGGGTARAAEEHAALAAFAPEAKVELTVLDFPDGRLPAHWAAVKQAVHDLAGRTEPDLVLAPHRGDDHQDHRLVAELTPNAFRDHLVLGYEIVKWDGDLHQPSVYQPLPPELARRKADLLWEHYPSQRDRDWFDPDTFLGLARVRGVQCHARYAEAFHSAKLTLQLGVPDASAADRTPGLPGHRDGSGADGGRS
jgi:LmbE family N-acetylglucosaminyl deacetylase